MLTRVTITGADESVHPRDLAVLAHDFPFVEWGILVSHNRQGEQPRYPSARWREMLSGYELNCAAHVCGSACRDFTAGAHPWAQRIQFNGVLGDEAALGNLSVHIAAVDHHGDSRPCIVQARNAEETEAARVIARGPYGEHVQALLDPSGGRGILPDKWPHLPPDIERGYAGGIGPGNVESVLWGFNHLWGPVAPPFWIDMETKVRTPDDRRFDLELARDVLSKAARFVGGP